MEVKEITVKQLNELLKESYDFQLVDVREPYETEIANLSGDLIPLNTLPQQLHRIDRERPVIVYCRNGNRSVDAICYLQKELGLNNLFNLKGGTNAWADEIDPTLQKY